MLLLISLLLTALSLAGLNGVVHLFFAIKALRLIEQAPPVHVDRAVFPSTPETFTASTESGDLVHGLIVMPEEVSPRGLVVFCPEAFGDAASAANYLPALLKHGIAVISIDFRTESQKRVVPTDRPNHWCTTDEIADTFAVLNYIARHAELSKLPVAMFGVCRGASAALFTGAERPEICGIACQGAFSVCSLQHYFSRRWLDREFGRRAGWVPVWHSRLTMWLTRKISEITRNCRYVHIERCLPKWSRRPVLFISAGSDGYVPADVSRKLCLLTGHDPDVDQWIVPGAKHNKERNVAAAEYDERLVQFFNSCFAKHRDLEPSAKSEADSLSSR